MSSVKDRLKEFLLDHIGEVVTKEQLMEVAAPATAWARRVRELRTEDGWPILSHHEPPSWIWLLGRVRVASVEDQRRLLEWLRGKFGE